MSEYEAVQELGFNGAKTHLTTILARRVVNVRLLQA